MKNFSLISLYHIKNLGVRSIHAFLKSKGYNSNLIFFKHSYFNNAVAPTDMELTQLTGVLKKSETSLVGISVSCSAYLETAKVITTAIKEALNIPVLWGGVHATVDPEGCIQYADMLCLGEGEYPMLELLDGMESQKDIKNIRNLWFNQEGGSSSGSTVIRNPLRPLINDLSSLPLPDYSNDNKYYINKDKLYEGDPIHLDCWDYFVQGTRGCPYSCTYCSNSLFKEMYRDHGKYIRQRSPEHVINELIQAKASLKGLKMITFFDEVFGVNKKWIEGFCQQYKEKGLNLPFSCYLHPLAVRDDTLKMLKGAGVSLIGVGIQSGSERVRGNIFKRPESNKQIIEAAATIRKHKIPLVLDLIMDNPFESHEDKDETLNLLLNIPKPFKLSLYSLIYFPKTGLTEMALKQGLITPDDIEDKRQRVLSQFRVTLGYEREKWDTAWISLLILSGTPWIPRQLVSFLARRGFLRLYPYPLVILVNITKGAGWIQKAVQMAISGQITSSLIKRFIVRGKNK
ncbi:B12-binding domain-containing radical SAM protein [bacterium]|nr:B12-binding domain-containing radical SAM protein [bacterium]MBU1754331.1 B12-binding domain-containing radical SAM protein [bacterium]